jgi:hypothetical protein
MRADSARVSIDDHLYRKPPDIPLENWTKVDEGTGKRHISSGSLIFHDDGMSCYSREALWLNFLCYEAVKGAGPCLIFSISVQACRDVGFGVVEDPNPSYISVEDRHPRDMAHTLVVHDDDMPGKQVDKRRSRLAKTARVVDAGPYASEFHLISEPRSGWEQNSCRGYPFCRCQRSTPTSGS